MAFQALQDLSRRRAHRGRAVERGEGLSGVGVAELRIPIERLREPRVQLEEVASDVSLAVPFRASVGCLRAGSEQDAVRRRRG